MFKSNKKICEAGGEWRATRHKSHPPLTSQCPVSPGKDSGFGSKYNESYQKV
jgi:hypothetical protein